MKRRSGFQIMKRLIVELKPLAPIMAITISMGVVGFLSCNSNSKLWCNSYRGFYR